MLIKEQLKTPLLVFVSTSRHVESIPSRNLLNKEFSGYNYISCITNVFKDLKKEILNIFFEFFKKIHGAYEHRKWCFQLQQKQHQIATKWCLPLQSGAFWYQVNNWKKFFDKFWYSHNSRIFLILHIYIVYIDFCKHVFAEKSAE